MGGGEKIERREPKRGRGARASSPAMTKERVVARVKPGPEERGKVAVRNVYYPTKLLFGLTFAHQK
jgi:hypothetical protein